MAIFKKLFTIDYKNKRFLILVDKYHRKTFLEVTPDGKYLYPEYEDFKELHEMYNNYDYMIKCGLYVSYEEKIRYKLTQFTLDALSILMLTNSIMMVNPNKKQIEFVAQSLYKDAYKDRDNLNLIYGDEVITREDVVEAINNNDKIVPKYKEIAIEVLDNNLALDPDADLRIYYENIKDLEILIIDNIHQKYGMYAAGFFKVDQDRICIDSKYVDDYHVAMHEFNHVFHDMCDTTQKGVVVLNETYGHSLEEAMTELIAMNIDNNDYGSYSQQRRMLTFFIDNVDEFNYHTYNTKGIMSLINELKIKYPDVDIDYLIDYLDTMTKTSIFFRNKKQLYKDENYVNELFKITVRNIDKDDVYRSFDTFYGVFRDYVEEDFYQKYFDLYNQELIKQGFVPANTFDLIDNINAICFIDGNCYFGVDDAYYYTHDGKKVAINSSDSVVFFTISDYIKGKIFENCVKTGNDVCSLENVISILKINGLYTTDSVGKLDQDARRNVLNTIFKSVTENIDPHNLYDGFDAVNTFMMYDNELYNYERNNYLKMYDEELIKQGLATKEQITYIRNAFYLANYNNQLHLFYGYDGSGMSFTGGYKRNLGYKYNVFTYGNDIGAFSISSDNEKIPVKLDTDIINIIEMYYDDQNRIIQYAVDNHIPDASSQTFLRKLSEEFELFNENECNIYSDGVVAFDKVTDDMYVEVGYDENSQIGLMLMDGNNLIYGTCKNFTSSTAKIPYRVYIKAINNTYKYIDEIISSEVFSTIYDKVLEYYAPNMDIDYKEVEGTHEGQTYTYVKPVYKFNKPIKTIVNGMECSIRSIYAYEVANNAGDNLMLHLPDGKNILIDDIYDDKYYLTPDFGLYFEFFDTYLKELNIMPDEDNTYSFTTEDIINIIHEYLDIQRANKNSR